MSSEAVSRPDDNSRQRLRRRLFSLVPVLAVVLVVYLFFVAGRYISTENAYVKADVLNISAEISGNVVEVAVRENQAVQAGDILLRIDDRNYQAELHDTQADLAQAYLTIASLKAAYRQKDSALAAARDDLAYARKQQRRVQDLHDKGVASSQLLDQAQRDLDVAANTVNRLASEQAETLARLGGNIDVDIERHPEVLAARASMEKAELNLQRCVIRAPIAGIASKVPQLGQLALPGLPMVSVVSNENIWLQANFKENQLAGLKTGAKVEVKIDAYPGETWTATVDSIAQATGAEFALLPPQNATGNWVKVVQRLPVRLHLEHHEGESPLRAGLSAEVTVDTGLPERLKVLAAWFGDAAHNDEVALVAGRP